jgi:amino acid adenylation domain-containing protein
MNMNGSDNRTADATGLNISCLFHDQVRLTPHRVALACRGDAITYQTLQGRVLDFAANLRDRGVRPNALVGLHMGISVNAVSAILAVLECGAAYVPLDASYPDERLARIIRDARLRHVVTETSQSELFSAHPEVCAVPFALTGNSYNPRDVTLCGSPHSPSTAAFVGYTSGSTGAPKGVVHSHKHLAHRIPFMHADEVGCLNAALSFSFSLSRLFPPLLVGARLVIPSSRALEDISVFLEEIALGGVTTIALVPSALRQILLACRNSASRLAALRKVTIAGDSLPNDVVELFFKTLPSAKLLYGFGASETGPVTIREIVPGDSFDERCVGVPQPNTKVLILDDKMSPVLPGTSGELYIGSPHLALGYLNSAELTKERFVVDEFSAGEKSVLFRTGDIGRYRPDRQIELLGRADNQVKIRGFRVQLEEIEHALLQHEAVQRTAVISRDVEGEKRLIAYVAHSQIPGRQLENSLRMHLRRLLPSYMMPFRFTFLESLPLTNTGKIDRNALKNIGYYGPESRSTYDPPRSSTEETIADVWREMLKLENVGIHENFLELGGDSLLATVLEARLTEFFDVPADLLSMNDQPTVAELASRIEKFRDNPSLVILSRRAPACY